MSKQADRETGGGWCVIVLTADSWGDLLSSLIISRVRLIRAASERYLAKESLIVDNGGTYLLLLVDSGYCLMSAVVQW